MNVKDNWERYNSKIEFFQVAVQLQSVTKLYSYVKKINNRTVKFGIVEPDIISNTLM